MEHRGGEGPVLGAGEPIALPQRDPRAPPAPIQRGPPPPPGQQGGPQALPQRQFFNFNQNQNQIKRQVCLIFTSGHCCDRWSEWGGVGRPSTFNFSSKKKKWEGGGTNKSYIPYLDKLETSL